MTGASAELEFMVHDLCAAVDHHEFEAFGAYFADTAQYRFANSDPVIGRKAIVDATAAAAALMPRVRHRVDQVAVIGRQLFCRFTIEVRAAAGKVAMPCVTVIELDRPAGPGMATLPKIVDYRVHMDVTPALQLSHR